MPMIFGNPEKNISNLVTFFADPFCSLSNFTPFIVHWQKNNHENYTNKYINIVLQSYLITDNKEEIICECIYAKCYISCGVR